ncbi:MAG: symmetrical bis(5'-nucleosyl)-tetraphosphatase [Gammaproteobacteria bacterium]
MTTIDGIPTVGNTYAVGDVRGNFQMLRHLLDQIRYEPEQDTLWFTGNLVNSGTDSLAVLRFVKDLGRRAVTVLGQQELRLLAVAEGVESKTSDDRFDDILAASDRDSLLKWLAQRPFLHHESNFTLVHAGIPAEWSLSQARTFAIEAESSLSMGNRKTFLENIAGDEPTRWHAKHRGWKRLRFIVNAFTRMRYCDDTGRLAFGAVETAPEGYFPWYRMAGRAMAGKNIVFGHRSAPADETVTGIFPLDTGCGLGGSLSAMQLASPLKRFEVPCG